MGDWSEYQQHVLHVLKRHDTLHDKHFEKANEHDRDLAVIKTKIALYAGLVGAGSATLISLLIWLIKAMASGDGSG